MSETEFIVALRPAGAKGPFALYWIDRDGRRELLASDPAVSCNQPVPLAARPAPPPRPSTVDYRRKSGTYYLQDIYAGAGLAGVPRGSIKRLRVIALSFRAAGIGQNYSQGVAGAALSSTPVSIGNGAWDPKTVLGEARVYDDGSAAFQVPARTPVYFQALDADGCAVQSMRSWSTVQPGERAACVGCHKSKNSTPRPAVAMPAALMAGVEQLAGFYGPPRGFSFPKEIQPILDRHCTRCHYLSSPAAAGARGGAAEPAAGRADRTLAADGAAFSLLAREVLDPAAKRRWSESYLALTHARPARVAGGPLCLLGQPGDVVNWIDAQSPPTTLPPYSAGAAKSRLVKLLRDGHGGEQLSREERAKMACWIDLAVPYCGDYLEANAWSAEEQARYRRFQHKRRSMERIERSNLEAWIAARAEGLGIGIRDWGLGTVKTVLTPLFVRRPCAGGAMIGHYSPGRGAVRPRRPCAGGAVIDHYQRLPPIFISRWPPPGPRGRAEATGRKESHVVAALWGGRGRGSFLLTGGGVGWKMRADPRPPRPTVPPTRIH